MSRYIDAEALEDKAKQYSLGYYGEDEWAVPLYEIADAPSIELEPKRGEWIYGEHDVAMCDGYRCNRCDFFVPWDYEHKFIDFINDYHFCPNCGARMKGADDESVL